LLIRRGKWKLFPNYVKTPDLKLRVFVRPSLVEEFLEKILKEVSDLEKKNVSPDAIAAFFHLNYVNVHPFDDTNGRTCRALVSLILMKNGLLPFNVSPDMKGKYIKSLATSTQQKDLSYLIDFIKKQQLKYIEALENDNFDDIIKNY
jgi:Fic family protein